MKDDQRQIDAHKRDTCVEERCVKKMCIVKKTRDKSVCLGGKKTRNIHSVDGRGESI